MTENLLPTFGQRPPGGRRSIARGSGVAIGASVLSIVASLALDVTVAAKFGATATTDTFWVAARLPIAIVAIVMVGGNQALVPAISTWTARRGQRLADRLTTGLLLGATVVGLGVGLLMAALATPLVRLTAPGLSRADMAAAVPMLRILAISVPLTIMAEVVRALLNARYSFGAPAAMTAVRSTVAAAVILAAGGHDIQLVAWAFVAGAVGQLVFLGGMAIWTGFRLRGGAGLRTPEVTAAGRLCVRPLAGATMNPAARIVEQIVVSFLPPGSITLLNYAYRLISAIGGSVFFRSVIVVIMPRLTEATAHGRDRSVARVTKNGVTLMLAIALPLTVFMAVLAQPATIGFFRRGQFDLHDAKLLGAALFVYSFSLIGSGVQRALLAPFFARLDTKTPLLNTAYGVAANLLLLVVFVLPFRSSTSLAVLGVALAYSLAQYVNVAHAWYRLRPIIPRPFAGTGAFMASLAVASSAAGIVLLVARVAFLQPGKGTHFLIAGSLVTAAVAGAVLAAVFWLVGGAEARRVLQQLSGRERPDPAPS